MKKQTYEEVVAAVKKVGAEIAKELGYGDGVITVSDFWANKGSDIITWGNKDDKKYIQYRTRFENPVLTIYDGVDMGNVECGRGSRPTGKKNKYGYDEYEKDNVYRPKEFMAFGAGGVKLMLMLKKRIEKATHKATNKFYE